jgi:hypothetical protein
MAVTCHIYQHTLLQNARTLRSRKVITLLDLPSRSSARRKRVQQSFSSLASQNEQIHVSPMMPPNTDIVSDSDNIVNPVPPDKDESTNNARSLLSPPQEDEQSQTIWHILKDNPSHSVPNTLPDTGATTALDMSSPIGGGTLSDFQMFLDEAVKQNNPISRAGSSEPDDKPESINYASSIATIETTLGFNEIGLPQNGSWEWESVLKKRYCFDHEEHKFLIQYKYRWMRPSDFSSPKAQDALEAKFEAYLKSPWTLDPLCLASQANCRSSYLSHVDAPIEQTMVDEEYVYQIQWLYSWTRQSNIDDPEAARSKYEDYLDSQGRRRSHQIMANAAQTLAGWEKVMEVVRIQ